MLNAQAAGAGRPHLLDLVAGFADPLPAARRQRFRSEVAALLDATPTADTRRALERMARSEFEWGYRPPVEFARSLSYLMGAAALSDGSGVAGGHHLEQVRGRAIILLANHLSYSDAHLVQYLLHAAGHEDLAERLTVVAGPKVFEDPVRRFTCTSFGMITTPQSQSCTTVSPQIGAREAVRLARRSIADAFLRLDAGDALLIFPEGTRARSGGMQPVLPAITRYLAHEGSVIVPTGLVGSQHVMPLGDDRLHLSKVTARFGPPLEAAELLDSCDRRNQRVASELGHRIASLLPPSYRGVYAEC